MRSAARRAHVEPLVRLEQLERLEAEPCPIVRRPGAAVAQDAAERRHPAEPAVRLEHPVALDAAVHLGSHAQLVEQVHLVPAGDAARRHAGVEQLVGPPQQRVQRLGRVALLERAVGELGEVPGRRRGLEVVAQVQPGVPDADLGHHVERPAAGEATCSSANGSRLPPIREVGLRMPLAIALSLPIPGVISVRTRSASPRSNRDSTIASVV